MIYCAPSPKWLFILTLVPILCLLLLSQSLWGSGEACYQFWRAWSANHPAVTLVARLVTDWGNPLVYAVYITILLQALSKNRPETLRLVAVYILVQLAIALLLTHFLKNLVGMPRPFMGDILCQPWTFSAEYQSFPSGHTVEIIGALLPLAVWRKRWTDAALCSFWLTAVAYSRVYLGRHYLLDIWGGVLVGSLAALLILYFASPMRTPEYERTERTE